MKRASAIISALYWGFPTLSNSISKLSTSGAQQNLQQPGTFFLRCPTSSPVLASVTGKFTSAHGPHGKGQHRPHWQHPPLALSTKLSLGSRMENVRSQQAKGSEMEPSFCFVASSYTSTTGLLKQRHVHVQSRFSVKAFISGPPGGVYAMPTDHGAQSGAHCLSCLVQQPVSSAAKNCWLLSPSTILYLFAISISCPMIAVTASMMLTCSLTLTLGKDRRHCMWGPSLSNCSSVGAP
mmetsp:Transcript_75074/g.223767  ORF Transcript_75074/g.223767 Transcript_75074/m.223767 type:complete len:237 (-) Transcript_75074:68-778(-)